MGAIELLRAFIAALAALAEFIQVILGAIRILSLAGKVAIIAAATTGLAASAAWLLRRWFFWRGKPRTPDRKAILREALCLERAKK